MSTFHRFAVACLGAFALVSEAPAADVALVPISASGNHSFVGNEIVLQGGGQRVFLELQISGWDPGLTGSPQLRAFQAVIDSTGYTSGLRGTLSPALEPCTTAPQCTAPFGGACSALGNACNLISDCQFAGPPLNETCNGTTCTFPTGIGGFCNPGFILSKRSDYVFFNVVGGDLPILDLTTNDFRFASATQSTAVADPGTVRYAATLVLEVPVGANGTFTVQPRAFPDTLLQDAFSQFILPLTLTPAVITVNCLTAADCNDGSDCTDDACTLGVCSSTPNFNTATQCCNPIGRVLTTIDDGNACTNDVCNAATGGVTHSPVPNGTICDDGAFCTVGETCVAGACGNGMPRNCSDGVGCTDDTCIESLNRCRSTANNANCDDGLFCTGSETCNAVLDCQAGTPPTCSDGVGCTIDTCDAATDACAHAPDNTACDDGLFCNGAETCSATLDCQAGTDPCPGQFCDDGPNLCVNCLVNAHCDDGLFCNGAETCVGGNCQAGTVVDCNDNVGCTDDSCDETFNTCRNIPNDTLCDDAVFCNGSELCNAVVDCQPGSPPTCNDGVGCTIDTCDAATDACSNAPDDTACDDGLFCNGAETCSATQDCQAGTDPCPGQFCDDGPNLCVNCLTNAHCDDGLFCNGAETCVGGNCQAGTVVDCSEGIACTDDACNETTDRCDHFPNDALCPDDLLFCNGIEFCNAAVGCDHRLLPCTGPCDEVLDLCSCIAPVLVRTGSRYLRVIPQSMTGAPMRLVVTPVCPAGGVSRCVAPPQAVDLDVDGAVDETVASLRPLGGNCPFLTPAQWGELYLADATIAPGSEYMVQADCGAPGNPSLSDGAIERTERFGDTAGVFDEVTLTWTPPNTSIDIFDLLAVIERFANRLAAPPIYWTDLSGIDAEGFSCSPDHVVSVIPDVIMVLNAFEGKTYVFSTGCPAACP